MACGSWTNYCQAVQTKPISWSTLYCRFDRELIPNIQITDEGLNELNTKLDLHSAPPKTSKSTRLLLLSTKMFWWLELFRKKTMEDNPFRFKPILKETKQKFSGSHILIHTLLVYNMLVRSVGILRSVVVGELTLYSAEFLPSPFQISRSTLMRSPPLLLVNMRSFHGESRLKPHLFSSLSISFRKNILIYFPLHW